MFEGFFAGAFFYTKSHFVFDVLALQVQLGKIVLVCV